MYKFRNLKIAITLLMIASKTHAQKPHIFLIDNEIDDSDLRDEFVVHRKSKYISSLPPKSKRDLLLKGVKQVEHWEEFKKDLFYMDLLELMADEVKQAYPEFTTDEITSLQKKIKE